MWIHRLLSFETHDHKFKELSNEKHVEWSEIGMVCPESHRVQCQSIAERRNQRSFSKQVEQESCIIFLWLFLVSEKHLRKTQRSRY